MGKNKIRRSIVCLRNLKSGHDQYSTQFIHLKKNSKTKKGLEKSEDRKEAKIIQRNMDKNERKDQLFPSKT